MDTFLNNYYYTHIYIVYYITDKTKLPKFVHRRQLKNSDAKGGCDKI